MSVLASQGLRVLLVDDSRTELVALRAMLQAEGFTVLDASNGEEAVRIYREHTPDIVLLDVNMPVMNGLDACRLMREHPTELVTPIVFLTAHRSERTLVKCFNAGGTDFITKPVSRITLGAKLTALVRDLTLQATANTQRRQIEAHNKVLLGEQEMAKALFDRVVQSNAGSWPNIKCTLSSSSIFNGDFVLVDQRPSGEQHVLVGDFTGHGLPAAMGAVPVAERFYRLTRSGFGIEQIALRINEQLCELLPTGHFLAAAFIELSMRDRRLRVLNAGLPDLVIQSRRSRQLVTLPSLNLPLGLVEHATFDVSLLRVQADDAIYACSDGIVELRAPDGHAFGIDRVIDAINSTPAAEAFDAVIDAATAFRAGRRITDDMTFVEIRCDAGLAAVPEPSAASLSPTGGIVWDLDSNFDAPTLRSIDVQQVATSIAAQLVGYSPGRDRVLTVLVELINNALDHGVLGLDSAMKETPEGFVHYYEERAARLARLESGALRMKLTHSADHGARRVGIRISDSGPGFDYELQMRGGAARNQHSGRGLPLVSSLCRSVEFRNGGSEVEVVLELAA